MESIDTVDQGTLNISADFLTGSTPVGLDRIRTRLLDLTNRNRLLNFRHSAASSVRVVDVNADAVFRRLRDNDKLAFLPVPEPESDVDELPTAKDYADELGWNTSFDLDDVDDDDAQCLPVLYYQDQLDTLSRKIASAARTAIEESGTNMLYLVIGFLEWFEADDSKQSHLAPLVILPVTIDRTGSKGKALEAVVEYSGEDVETNLSLVEKMRRDFGIEIPLIEDDDTPTAYFDKFGSILKVKKRWAIRRQITLTLLSFGKLLMYRDLDPKTWPAAECIAKHPLVRQLFEGSKTPNISLAEEYPIDAPELNEHVPHLIRDADSSQHSALVDAIRGQNLVLEGPPGTGKSQTITNLIAAALANGKTVLFVSEKLAALEVVRRRLDDAGLGVFCLELHSHKTNKGALIKDLAQRYQLRGTYRDPRDLDRQLSVVDEKKRLLTDYAALINKTIEPFKATVFEILWARDRCGQEIPALRDRLGATILPAILRYTPTQFTQADQFLAVYAQHLTAAFAPCTSLDRHPWAWITKPLDFEAEDRVLGLLSEFLAVIGKADECCERLQEPAGITLTRTAPGLEYAADTIGLLPTSRAALMEDLLAPCQAAANREKLAAFVEQVESFRRATERLDPSVRSISPLLEEQTSDKLSCAQELVQRCGLEGQSVAEVRELLNALTATAKLISNGYPSLRILLELVGCNAPPTLSSVAFLLEAIRVIEATPFELLHMRCPALEKEGARPIFETARQEASALLDQEASLAKEFHLSLAAEMYSPPQLLNFAAVLDQAALWERLFGRAYRHATKTYRRIARAGENTGRGSMSRALRSIAEYAKKHNQFDNNSTYREMLGVLFQGVSTRWDDLHELLLWYERVFTAFPEHQPHSEPFRQLLLTARVERLKRIKANASLIEEHRRALDQIVSGVEDLLRLVPSQRALVILGSLDEISMCVQNLARDVSEVLQAIDAAGIVDDVSLRNIPEILRSAAQACRHLAAAEAAVDARVLLGEAFRGVHTEIAPIRHTLELAQSVAAGDLPHKTVTWLLCREYASRLRDLRTSLSTAHECARRLRTITENLSGVSGSSLWSDGITSGWHDLQALAQSALMNREELPRWNHFLRVRQKSTKSGLDKLTALADARTLEPSDLGRAFHFVFYNTLARSVFSENAELSHVSGVTQDQLRQQFAAADKDAIRLYSQRVAALIDQRPIPYGNQSGPVRTWTELALVINEIKKQKRHIPIRQLVLRAGNALVALKPCFMMGPLSVAQYLAPGQLKFDLVVMDEASQLKPEDAIGALARGGQVVIVGDPKQLPPTTFFQRVSLDSEEDPEESRAAVEEGESILDVASTLFQPVRRLRWHYRSRHHSLIAFSNNEFYQRDLVIFPSAYHDDLALGVKHHFVPNGVYENSRNPREAAVVVQAVLDHMRYHPDESLGVVTLNFEQRELVEELLDRQLRDDPAAIAFQERMKGGQETLFVKNLENVQGDERDVIFISTTYGPDARGNQFQRFGPINAAGGHRRLNVLFTRAKKRTVVFSSLDPERIQTTTSSAWGVRALKQYLMFARTGVLEGADDGMDQPTNDFERAVGAALKEKGYSVVPQVGVAGFFIDLGVKHPVKPGTFLLGIECDGASYHSGRSARDRDRLRQEILENLGWKIHRIWSTDWFKSRDSEISRLFRRIDDLLAHDPVYVQEQKKVNRADLLRQQLIALRETEIRPAFPNTAAERGLLRKSLLDEFVQKRPKTREDWFRRIPEQVRSSVDPKQIGQYLHRVLDIIAASEDGWPA